MEKIMQSKKVVKIICVVFAILLWIYVSYQENPSMTKTVRNVPIAIVGEQALKENGFSVYSVSEKSVDVKATANRLSLARVNNKTLSASVNVSSIKKAGTHVIPATVTSSISSGGSFYTKGNDITVIIEPIVKQAKSIEVDISTPKDSSVVLKSYTLSEEKVTISAPKSIVNDIASIRTEQVVPGNKGASQTARLVVYAKNGKILEGVECEPAKVTVSYSLYDVKRLPILLKTSKGHTFPLPTDYTVEVYGSGSSFNSLKAIETHEIDLSDYKVGTSISITLNLPDRVYINNGSDIINLNLDEKFFERN